MIIDFFIVLLVLHENKIKMSNKTKFRCAEHAFWCYWMTSLRGDNLKPTKTGKIYIAEFSCGRKVVIYTILHAAVVNKRFSNG